MTGIRKWDYLQFSFTDNNYFVILLRFKYRTYKKLEKIGLKKTC